MGNPAMESNAKRLMVSTWFQEWPLIASRAVVCCLGWVLLCASTGCHLASSGQNSTGVQLFQQGRYNEALQYFEAAKQSSPANADSYYNLAATYHKLGVVNKDTKMIDQAEALYNQCLDIAPNHVECHRGLAVMLVESNRQDKAFNLLKNWANRNPNL